MQLDALPRLRPYRPSRVTLEALPDGEAGIRATLKRMRDLVNAAKADATIYDLARQIIRGEPEKDYPREARAVQAWVQQHIRYTRDPDDLESLQEPSKTVELGQGDCDDQAMLVAALLASIGARTRFHAIGAEPGVFSHVFAEVLIDGSWFALETTEDWSFCQRYPNPTSHMVVNV